MIAYRLPRGTAFAFLLLALAAFTARGGIFGSDETADAARGAVAAVAAADGVETAPTTDSRSRASVPVVEGDPFSVSAAAFGEALLFGKKVSGLETNFLRRVDAAAK